MKKLIALVSAVALCAGMLFAQGGAEGGAQPSFNGKNVRVVIGSTSTGGDSYLIADATMRYLGKYLNANFKVDAVGASQAYSVLSTAKPDGSTIMMFHDMTYLAVLFGAYGDEYALENFVVGPEAAQNPTSGWAAKKDAPYQNLAEIPEYLKANPDKTVRMACEAGGVSQVGFVAFYDWVKRTYGEDIAKRCVVIVGGSTAEKCQMLWDGNCDVIFADYTSLLQYTQTDDAKIAMKFMGLLDNIDGVTVPSYKDLGITLDGKPFAFSKDFVIYLPKDMPESLVKELDEGMAKVGADPQYKADLAKMNYRPAYKPSAEAKTFIYGKRDSLKGLIENSPSMDELIQK